jgi:hypothetical protein
MIWKVCGEKVTRALVFVYMRIALRADKCFNCKPFNAVFDVRAEENLEMLKSFRRSLVYLVKENKKRAE